MIDAKEFFDQPINNMIKTYENIRKNTIFQGYNYRLVVYETIPISKNT